uniref:Potassium channel tetramerization domain containing 18 n=1 Tax=Equus caballus TaxID=9796 RepID=A0A3Q2L6S2_HORSE
MEGHKAEEEVFDILRLNVGGSIYTARRESLCRFKDSMLASMFSGRFPLKTDESGVSYWRVPHELIECWTLEERPLLGSLRHMAPIRKRRLVEFNEEEEGVNCKTGPKPVRFVGPSTSTQIKVKNSASVRVSPARASQAWSRAPVSRAPGGKAAPRPAPSAAPTPAGTGGPGHSQASCGSASAENGATHPSPAKVLLPDKKGTPHRVIKLKRTPLSTAGTAARPAGPPPPPGAPSALGVRTENGQDKTG